MKVHKIGNSLMVAIPHEAARRLDIHEGDEVQVIERERDVVIQPSRHRPPLTFVGSIHAGGAARRVEYEPDPWR